MKTKAHDQPDTAGSSRLAIGDMAEACFANRLRRAARAISRHYDSALKVLDLKVSQLSVLAAAHVSGGTLTIVDIAERLGMDRSTLSRNLEPLERRGLVAVGPEERHRARRIRITDAGEALLQRAYPVWKAVQTQTAASASDLPDALRSLDPLLAKMDS